MGWGFNFCSMVRKDISKVVNLEYRLKVRDELESHWENDTLKWAKEQESPEWQLSWLI